MTNLSILKKTLIYCSLVLLPNGKAFRNMKLEILLIALLCLELPSRAQTFGVKECNTLLRTVASSLSCNEENDYQNTDFVAKMAYGENQLLLAKIDDLESKLFLNINPIVKNFWQQMNLHG